MNKKTIIGILAFVIAVSFAVSIWSWGSGIYFERCSQAKAAYEANPKLAQEEYGFETYEEYARDIQDTKSIFLGIVC